MKTRFRKLLPVLIMAVAVAGAFSTHAMDKKAEMATLVTGYIKLNPSGSACQSNSTTCQIEGTGTVCRVNYNPASAQIFRKDASGNCAVALYRPDGM
jgi:hypothetical protein